jgi:hypothetical protein
MARDDQAPEEEPGGAQRASPAEQEDGADDLGAHRFGRAALGVAAARPDREEAATGLDGAAAAALNMCDARGGDDGAS